MPIQPASWGRPCLPVTTLASPNSSNRYFAVSIDPSLDVYLTVSAASGDPDVYASFSSTAPSRSDYQYAATAATDNDEMTITKVDPGFCPHGPNMPCVLAIAVYGFSTSAFTITVTQRKDSPITLADGIPVVRIPSCIAPEPH